MNGARGAGGGGGAGGASRAGGGPASGAGGTGAGGAGAGASGGAGGAGAGRAGAGGAGPNLLNQLIAALNMLHQHNRCPIPIFSGLPNEDLTQFKQKALDYMEDALIPAADQPRKFRLCLQGEAHDWYNDIMVPAQWDALMNMFCQCFCIFGQTEEQWHEALQKLSFDCNNGNIDQFINKVKRLARQLQFRNESILIKLKQLFPEKADMWLVVHDLDEMCGYLKKLPVSTTTMERLIYRQRY